MDKIAKTTNAKLGGLTGGKSHDDGGVKAIIVDTNKPIEIELGEAVVNKEAVKKHWKELSKINQSAGGGVPILDPNKLGESETKELKLGGNLKQTYVGEVGESKIALGKGFINQFDGKKRFEISDKKFKIIANFDELRKLAKENSPKETYIKLDELVKHDLLFKAYPELKDLEFTFFWNDKVNSFAYYRPSTNTINYNFYGEAKQISMERKKSGRFGRRDIKHLRRRVLLHELQHFVQSVEHFAKGTSEIREYNRLLQENGIDERTISLDDEKIYRQIAKERNKNSAGELEAKDTEYRINLTDKERKNIPPLSHNKYEIKDVDVRFENGGGIGGTSDSSESGGVTLGGTMTSSMKLGGKIEKVMNEYKEGELKTSYGKKVTNPKQAIAIAISEENRMDTGGSVGEEQTKNINTMEKELKKGQKYEGSSKGTGALYEFFTPDEAVKKMWELVYENGFKVGNILEPALGSGRLLKYAPKNCNLTAFEISKENFNVSKEVLKPYFNELDIYNDRFETAFLESPRFNTRIKKGVTWLKQYPFDLVIANPPYGEFTGLYKTHFKFSGQFEHWFIEYTMKLVKSGGLGVFLVPSSFMRNGISYNDVKKRIFEECKLIDAYRLPSNIFKKTQIGTDIIILKKK